MISRAEIFSNLSLVRDKIEEAAHANSRNYDEIRLVIVTKGHPIESVLAITEMGEKELGESYAEEGYEKLSAFKNQAENQSSVKWHMIGHVQSRKAKIAAQHFDLLHSLDSLKLARRLNRFAKEAKRILPVLLEVNVSGEKSKYGWPTSGETVIPDLFAAAEEVLKMKNLMVQGLMSIAPFAARGEKAQPYFEQTRIVRNSLSVRFPDNDWSQLSMGMSGDFEAAIREGATIVRIGSAILGPRKN